jgi:hypothetical protein
MVGFRARTCVTRWPSSPLFVRGVVGVDRCRRGRRPAHLVAVCFGRHAGAASCCSPREGGSASAGSGREAGICSASRSHRASGISRRGPRTPGCRTSNGRSRCRRSGCRPNGHDDRARGLAVVVLWGLLVIAAVGTLLWLVHETRVAPRRRRAAQRETAARLRLELSRRREPHRRRVRQGPPPLSLAEVPASSPRVLPSGTEAGMGHAPIPLAADSESGAGRPAPISNRV